MKHTKGKFKHIESVMDIWGLRVNEISIDSEWIAYVRGSGDGDNVEEREANAELIAEAFNITNELGLTPSQLYKQNQELLKALLNIRNEYRAITSVRDDYANNILTKVENAITNTQNATPVHKAGK